MRLKRVSFQTTASTEEIEEALSQMGYISYLSIQGADRPIKKPRQKWSDNKQLAAIWGAVAVTSLSLFMFIEWGTRP